jgi:adhesin transport system membrane fusion protein
MPLPGALMAVPTTMAPSRAARLAFWLIAGFLGLLLLWASLTSLATSVSATGRVVPAGRLQVLSHPEGGQIKAILVRPGQRVEAGQPLVRLDPGLAAGELGRSASSAQALAARIARLEAEASDTSPVFPSTLEAEAPALVASERSLWRANMQDRDSAASAERARLDAARRSLAEAEADASARTEASAQAARELALVTTLVDKGLEPRISLDRARSGLAQAQAAASAGASNVARARAMVREAEAGLASLLSRRRASAGDALAVARAELAQLEAGLPALAGRVDRAMVKSPVAGTVNRLLVNTIGSSAAPGAALVEVVPAGEALVIDAQLKPADIGFVHAGQKARIRLTAYDSAVFGSLDGAVAHISPDASTNERTGETHYDVRIATSGMLHDQQGRPLAIAPGMVAEVSLLGPERSVLAYLLSPFTRLSQQAFREK